MASSVPLPFLDAPDPLTLGVTAIPLAELFVLDATTPDQLAERRRLLDTRHAEVFAARPAADAAAAELLRLLAELLPRRFPETYAADHDTIRNLLTDESWKLSGPLHPLEVAGRLVQEDLLLLTPQGVLEAAVLCFPSRWRLAEKIGRPLAAIHAPVPGYAARLAGPVDRFIARLAPGRAVLRRNWSVLDEPALFQPDAAPPRPGAPLFLRTERQTLTRLSTHVLFTLRIRVTPLAAAITTPAHAASLAAAIRALPPALAAYKGLSPLAAPLLAWLDARSAMIGPPEPDPLERSA